VRSAFDLGLVEGHVGAEGRAGEVRVGAEDRVVEDHVSLKATAPEDRVAVAPGSLELDRDSLPKSDRLRPELAAHMKVRELR
jgi:hypothetical protein